MSESSPSHENGNRATRNPNRPLDQYKRTYKACIHCRDIKAKCIPTPDTNNCLRCQRERRECIYPAQRSNKRRKTDDGHESQENGRTSRSVPYPDLAWTPHAPDIEVSGERQLVDNAAGANDNNYADSSLDRGEDRITSSNDALRLLFRAAQQQDYDGERYEDNVWSQYSLVKNGLISPGEAAQYVRLFFDRLSPLSVIPDTYYEEHTNHKQLIQEPLLCAVILMVSSRYNRLSGQSLARNTIIHDRIWSHVYGLIQALVFGTNKALRTLGTVQALLLITEWHPRSLHYSDIVPMNNSGELATGIDLNKNFSNALTLEASRRSDHMSWSLLGLAVTLSHELSIFPHRSGRKMHASNVNNTGRIQTQRLLYLYVTHLAVRLGYTNLIHPEMVRAASQPLFSSATTSQLDRIDRENMILKWMSVTSMLEDAIIALERQPKEDYRELIYVYEQRLSLWLTNFNEQKLTTVLQLAKDVLLLEYHHVRVCINSIALNAVTARLARSTHNPENSTSLTTPSDDEALKTMQDSCIAMLSIGIRLHEKGQLRLAPVRVFLRLVAAGIFLLKISLLPLTPSVLFTPFNEFALSLLDTCIQALKSCHADDDHLSTKYGMLLERHVFRIREQVRARGIENMGQQLQQQQQQQQTVDIRDDENDASTGPDQDWSVLDNGYTMPFMEYEDAYLPGLALDGMDFFWNISP